MRIDTATFDSVDGRVAAALAAYLAAPGRAGIVCRLVKFTWQARIDRIEYRFFAAYMEYYSAIEAEPA
jgi:hypothetical protein